jgi:hypothetical protein
MPYWGSKFRMREKARLAKVRMEIHLAARKDRKRPEPVEERSLRLLGVFPAPTAQSTALLDALAEDVNVKLDVVYPSLPSGDGNWTQSPRHVHWFARTTRFAQLDRLLGREYPITWTIWHSFYFLKPDCMLISGWSTFPAQAAIAWCIARRVPYLLLVDEDAPAVSDQSNGGAQRTLVGAVERRSAAVLPGDATDERVRALLELTRQAREARTARDPG